MSSNGPCSHKTTCPLFPLFRDQRALGFWQVQFCDGDHQACARFQQLNQGDTPPLTLLPNGKLLELPGD